MDLDRQRIKGMNKMKIFFLPFICVGLFALYFSIKNVRESNNCTNWHRTTANVDKVNLLMDNEDGVTTYCVKLDYHYSQNKKNYNGNRIAFGYNFNNTDNHQGVFDVLKDAKKIIVYINPKKSNDAVVVPGMNNSIKGNLIFAGIWNSFVVIFWVFFFSGKNNNMILLITVLGLFFMWIAGYVWLNKEELNIHIENKIEVVEKIG